jgi:hypothetical protein
VIDVDAFISYMSACKTVGCCWDLVALLMRVRIPQGIYPPR